MGVLFLLIAISLGVALSFLFIFFRAVKKGQYDDNYTPSVRMLFDNELKENPKKENRPNTNKGAEAP